MKQAKTTVSMLKWKKEIATKGGIKEVKFRCPVCVNIQSVKDFEDFDLSEEDMINSAYYLHADCLSIPKELNNGNQ